MARQIILIHGAWVNGQCWDSFQKLFEERGYSVITPSWLYDDRTVEELNASPNPALAKVGLHEIVAHYDKIVRNLPEPPIIIGHSFGGLTTQILLDRGLGVAGVAIDSAPPKGVKVSGVKEFIAGLRVLLPVLLTPFSWRRILRFSFKGFRYGWANTTPPELQYKDWKGYIIPSPGKPFWQNLFSMFNDTSNVDFKNSKRAPLLLIAGGADHAVPPSANVDNYNKYQGNGAVTGFKEFAGRGHWTIKQPGWEEVAGYAIDWVEKQIGK